MDDNKLQIQIPWYKTAGGITFLSVLGIFFLIVLVFVGFVAYYAYQIQIGNGANIARQIQASKKFSTSKEISNIAVVAKDIDPSPYIRPYNPRFGNMDSPVTIIAFIDFECPFSQQAFSIFEKIRNHYESGVNIIFKYYPLTSIHPLAEQASLAASCAQAQNAFWPYYKQLFETKTLSKDELIANAEAIGLDKDIFTICLEKETYKNQIMQDMQDGLDLGVRGTPTYFIKSKKMEGVVPLDMWNTEIIKALQL